MNDVPFSAATSRILVVEDDEQTKSYLVGLLEFGGYDKVHSVSNTAVALDLLSQSQVDLVLLDLQLTGKDGFALIQDLRNANAENIFLPILVLTSDTSPETMKRALDLGASDFLHKQASATELLPRMKNFLTMRAWSRELSERNMDLEARVTARTVELEKSQVEIVERLAMAGERRDDLTGQHTLRVGWLSRQIAQAMDLPSDLTGLIGTAARLHDLGKIGIPDSILMKQGKLSAEETTLMKQHSTIGAGILSDSRSALLKMAERIAASHHERYDGTGYPAGLAGAEIPVEARIVAVADVFDALTTTRPYKAAWDMKTAVAEIRSKRGTQFDPEVVDGFLGFAECLPELYTKMKEEQAYTSL